MIIKKLKVATKKLLTLRKVLLQVKMKKINSASDSNFIKLVNNLTKNIKKIKNIFKNSCKSFYES